MAQRNSEGVADDVRVRFVDWLLRAVVVVALVVCYLGWLERSPVPALLCGAVVAVVFRAWRRAPWLTDDRRETERTAGPRPTAAADLDRMTGREFQQLIVRLMDRDNFVAVRATGLRDDLSTDVVAHTPAGHKVVVQCRREAPHRRMDSSDVRRFLETAQDEHSADITVLVTTGRFTQSAMAVAEQSKVLLLDGRQVQAWLTGRATWPAPYLSANV